MERIFPLRNNPEHLGQTLILISAILWSVWKGEMNGYTKEPNQILWIPMNTLRKAYMFQSECLTMMRSDMQQTTSSIGVRQERNTSWRPPPLGFIKVNTDASWSPGTSIHSISAIARDSQGQPLSGSARLIYALPLLLQKRWLWGRLPSLATCGLSVRQQITHRCLQWEQENWWNP